MRLIIPPKGAANVSGKVEAQGSMGRAMDSLALPTPAVRKDISEVFCLTQGSRREEQGSQVAEGNLPSGMGQSHCHPHSPAQGDKVIFHKHYLTCFVGDKVFAKLCRKSRAFCVTTARTAACSDWLQGPPAWLAQNTGTSKWHWVYLV